MPKNLGKTERIARVVLGVGGILTALLATEWIGWIRLLVGLLGVAFLATAAGSY